MKIRNILSSLLLGAVIAMPVFVHAENADDAIVKIVSDFDGKPEQHIALANYYKEKAVVAKKDLEIHLSMKRAYINYNGKNSGAYGSMLAMCDELIQSNQAAIKAYEEMASEHEKDAK